MSYKRILTLLVAAHIVALIAVTAAELYVVRDLLAALLMFCTLLVALGITVLVLFLLAKAVERCLRLLVTCTASLPLHQPVPSVASRHPQLGYGRSAFRAISKRNLPDGGIGKEKIVLPAALLMLASLSTMAQRMPQERSPFVSHFARLASRQLAPL
jgi:hypothetical protein